MWNNELYTGCDSTGIVYKIDLTTNDLIPVYVLINGNGTKKNERQHKIEWMTIQYNKLVVGSIGKEWVENDKIIHTDSNWVKIIDKYGKIENVDFTKNYLELRKATNFEYPSYLQHEAAFFDEYMAEWIFAPRKASKIQYSEKEDETKGSNILITSNSRFSKINVKYYGELENDYGCSSIKKLKNVDAFVLIKTKELSDPVDIHSKLLIIDQYGKNLSIPLDLGNIKFEGVEIFKINKF